MSASAHTRVDWQDVAAGPGAAVTVARLLAGHLQRALAQPGDALLALAGGRTPEEPFRRLAALPCDWQRVHIVPTDERWVPLGHADCNESMLRRCFERAGGAGPRFLSLRGNATELPAAVADARRALAAHAGLLALTLLGVGADGHIASLFPGAPELAAAMAADAPHAVYSVHPTPAAPPPPVPRLTLGLRRLLHTRQVVLLFGGADKRRVVEAARRAPDPLRVPVGALFQAGLPPVQVIYLEGV